MQDQPKGLKKRPLYDPMIEQLNDKARDAASVRNAEAKLDRSIEHEKQSSEGRNTGVAEHGRRVKPERCSYLGSLCVHVYAEGGVIGKRNQLMSLSPGIERIAQPLAVKAIESLSLHVMHAYGVKQPGTLDKKKQQEKQIKDAT